MMKIIFVCVAFASLLLSACGGKGTVKSNTVEEEVEDKDSTTIVMKETGEDTDDEQDAMPPRSLLMPEELSAEDVEVIRKVMALQGDEELVMPDTDRELKKRLDPQAYHLLLTIYQMWLNYDGPHYYAYLWTCEERVEELYLNYLKQKGQDMAVLDEVAFNKVMSDFDPIYECLGCGSQYDINISAAMQGIVETYKTIGAYRDMVVLLNDTSLQKMYFLDFAEWENLVSTIAEVMDGHHSAFPMEVCGYRSEIMRLRYALLQEELELLRSGKPCGWNTEEHAIRWELGEDEYDNVHTDLLRHWYEQRMTWADAHHNHPFAETLRRMTHKIVYTYSTTVHFGMEPI
jgi:hypothetical protein